MLRCLICRQKKSAWKKMKTHFMARHSKLVCQVMKLFSKNKLTNLMHTLTKPLSNKSGRAGSVKTKKKVQKTRYSRIYPTANSSRSSSPSRCSVQINVDAPSPSTEDEVKLGEKKVTRMKREPNKSLVNEVKRVRKRCSNKTENTDETGKIDIRSCKANLNHETTVTSNSAIVQGARDLPEINSYENEKDYVETIKKSESDTESCSDNGKNIIFQNPDFRYYCKVCGNGYNNEQKLLNHFRIHAVGPKLDRIEFLSTCRDYRPVPPPFKVFACYVCTSEFFHKKALLDHLNVHYEYEIMEGVLDMEQDYNLPKTLPHPHPVNLNHMGNLDYRSSLKYITQYLLSSMNVNDQYYYNNNNYINHTHNNFNNKLHSYSNQKLANYFMRIVCDYCYQDIYSWEYKIHLMHVHNVIANF